MKQIAMLFPGQGSQTVGMGRRLHDSDAATRELFALAAYALAIDMAALCFDGPAERLNQTEFTQPALLLCSVAAYRRWRADTGLAAHAMAGHSLGELSALVCAGAIEVADGLKLARERGLAMARCRTERPCGMLAVTALDRDAVERICAATAGFGADFVIANLNAPRQLVLSGASDALERAGAALREAGATLVPLRVSGPFHSPFMRPALADYAAALQATPISAPQVPVVGNVGALPHGTPDDIRESLLDQVASPVRWSDTLAWLDAQGTDVYLEAGPRDVLTKLVHANLPSAVGYALDTDDAAAATGWRRELAGDLRSVAERPTVPGKCMAVAVCTPNTNWDDAAYQQGVVEPYRELQTLHEQAEQAGGVVAPEQMRRSLALLARIFATKGTPADERRMRYRQILTATGTAEVLADDVAALS